MQNLLKNLNFAVYSRKWDPSFKFPDERQLIVILSVYLGQLLCNLTRLNFRGLLLRPFVKMRLGLTDSTAPLEKKPVLIEMCLVPSLLPTEPTHTAFAQA